MRQALIKTAIISAREDEGALIARLVRGTGMASCEMISGGAFTGMAESFDAVILEGEPPDFSWSSFSLPKLFVGDFTPDEVELLRRGQGPCGILGPRPNSETLASALLSLRNGLSVLDHRHFVCSNTGASAAPAPDSPRGDKAAGLTEKETAVLDFFARGFSTKETSAYLGVSENTVKFHASSIYEKLGVSNRAEAVIEGVRLGYLSI